MEIKDYRIAIVQSCITAQGILNTAVEKMNADENKERGRFIFNHANYVARSSLYNLWVFLSKDLEKEDKDKYDFFFLDNFKDEEIEKYQAFIHGMTSFTKEYKHLFEAAEKEENAKKIS